MSLARTGLTLTLLLSVCTSCSAEKSSPPRGDDPRWKHLYFCKDLMAHLELTKRQNRQPDEAKLPVHARSRYWNDVRYCLPGIVPAKPDFDWTSTPKKFEAKLTVWIQQLAEAGYTLPYDSYLKHLGEKQ